jgi:membrane protein DedA with SNARE-associated domain
MFDWITSFLETTGAFGIALLMFLENVFPPIPSELIMPMAGFAAARGEQSIWLVIASGTTGSLAGAGFWYWIGRKLGRDGVHSLAERHGRWLTLCPPDVEHAVDRFQRHGATAVFLGRLVPALRSVISIPAGIARMDVTSFLLFSALGTSIWTAALAGAGYMLEGQYERVSTYLNPVSNLAFGALAAWYAYRVITFGKQRSKR